MRTLWNHFFLKKSSNKLRSHFWKLRLLNQSWWNRRFWQFTTGLDSRSLWFIGINHDKQGLLLTHLASKKLRWKGKDTMFCFKARTFRPKPKCINQWCQQQWLKIYFRWRNDTLPILWPWWRQHLLFYKETRIVSAL